MSLNRDDWLMLGVAAALAATGFGAAGIGPMAGLFGAEAAAGAGLLGAEAAAGAGAAGAGGMAAGESLLGGLGAGGGMGAAGAELAAPGIESIIASTAAPGLAESALLGSLPTGLGVEPGWAAANAGTGLGTTNFSLADVIGAVPEAEAGAFAPQAAQASKGLSAFQKAMLYGQLGQMVSGSSQRPAGSPMLDAPPQVRQQLQSQEEITKRWLQKNDPNTFARLYGSTGLMG